LFLTQEESLAQRTRSGTPNPDPLASGVVHVSPSRSFHWWLGLSLIALIIYIVAATYQLTLPGLNYDEAADAVPAMNMVLHQPLDGAITVQLFGHAWPLMIMPYIGPMSTYVAALGFLIGGVSALTLRLTTVFVGVLTLLLMWGFLKTMFDVRVASIAVLLLAVDPNYIFWSRMGAFIAQPLLPMYIAALWCLFAWHRGRGFAYLASAAFLMGLGLSTKLLYLWVWAALGAGWLLLSPWTGRGRGWRKWLWPFERLSAARLVLVAAAAVAGSSIVIFYNLQGAGSWHFFADHVSSASGGISVGAAGATLLSNIRQIGLNDLKSFLDGSWFVGKLGDPPVNGLAAPARGAGLAVIGLLVATGRLRYRWQRVAWLLILMVTFIVSGAAFSVSHGANHLILVWPIPEALIAIAVISVAEALSLLSGKVRRLGLAVVVAAALCVLGAEVWTTYGFHQALARTGGEGPYSDAIYALANDLEQPGTPPALLFDWGFLRNLQIITANRAQVSASFTYASPPLPVFENLMEEVMARPDDLYVFNVPQYTAFPGHWELFERVAYRHRLTPVLWKTYSQRDGKPVYLAYRLEPTSPLTRLPATARPLNDVRLGDSIMLLGYDPPAGTARPGHQLQLTLYWQASATQMRSYKVFAALLDDQGQSWAQHDAVPVDWGYPTTQWQPGEVVADRIWLPVKPDAKPGSYHVFIGMYDQETGERIPLWSEGQRLKGDTLNLLEVSMQP
jgi:4-amino-4-deoxy-L-arabinose transferase-like glycosyltransferase